MFEALRKLVRPPPREPCRHPHLIFDWYRDVGIATCAHCAEVFLASELGLPGPDWAPASQEGSFDGS